MVFEELLQFPLFWVVLLGFAFAVVMEWVVRRNIERTESRFIMRKTFIARLRKPLDADEKKLADAIMKSLSNNTRLFKASINPAFLDYVIDTKFDKRFEHEVESRLSEIISSDTKTRKELYDQLEMLATLIEDVKVDVNKVRQQLYDAMERAYKQETISDLQYNNIKKYALEKNDYLERKAKEFKGLIVTILHTEAEAIISNGGS